MRLSGDIRSGQVARIFIFRRSGAAVILIEQGTGPTGHTEGYKCLYVTISFPLPGIGATLKHQQCCRFKALVRGCLEEVIPCARRVSSRDRRQFGESFLRSPTHVVDTRCIFGLPHYLQARKSLSTTYLERVVSHSGRLKCFRLIIP